MKTKLDNSLAWEAFDRCCKVVKTDPECGYAFLVQPFPSGACYCEKKGRNCYRGMGAFTEYEQRITE